MRVDRGVESVYGGKWGGREKTYVCVEPLSARVRIVLRLACYAGNGVAHGSQR